ncbi:hypothetical protein CDAR_101831 [Caerostris darwini]|uniref:Uncharacterized protein n=1 Tax=Caerostris darwini TaxID=1538125 RepID=A0AAV4R372_9ARAC|nr:hypothetical protein CDAR_101831 [Caerostris darwini]
MGKYLEKIQDLSKFILEKELSEDMKTLFPQNVFAIVETFDKYDYYYQMDEFELDYLYEFHFNGEDIVGVKDNLKMLELPMSLDIEEETRKLKFNVNGLKIEEKSNILEEEDSTIEQNSNILEEEDSTIEFLIDDLDICGDKNIAGINKMCSYCGEKCFKYLLFQIHKRMSYIEDCEPMEI